MSVKSAFISFNRKINTFEDAKHLESIGIRRGTSSETELEGRGFENLRSFSTPDRLLKFFDGGRIDAWLGSVHEFTKRIRRLPPEKQRQMKTGETLIVEQLWLAGSKKLAPEIVADLNNGMRLTLEEGHRSRLMNRARPPTHPL